MANVAFLEANSAVVGVYRYSTLDTLHLSQFCTVSTRVEAQPRRTMLVRVLAKNYDSRIFADSDGEVKAFGKAKATMLLF